MEIICFKNVSYKNFVPETLMLEVARLTANKTTSADCFSFPIINFQYSCIFARDRVWPYDCNTCSIGWVENNVWRVHPLCWKDNVWSALACCIFCSRRYETVFSFISCANRCFSTRKIAMHSSFRATDHTNCTSVW